MMSLRVKFQTMKYTRALKRQFSKFTKDRIELKKVSKILLKEIKADTIDGKSFDGSPLPPLKTKTKDRRARLSEFNMMSRFFKAPVSNASFMGDTLKNLAYDIASNTIYLFGKGKHRYIMGVRGKRLKGSNAPISSILMGLKDLGWNILGVSKGSRKKIMKNFKRWLRRKL